MAIVFFGTPSFAAPSLEGLIAAGENVSLIVTQPDRLQGRGRKLIYSPVKEFALRNNLPLLQPESLRDPAVSDFISRERPEFLIVVAYGKILPQGILDIPARGAINVHGSLLPKFRGAAPIQWSLIKGEPLTGITTMHMDAGMDTGNILLQETTPIYEHDNAKTLSDRLSAIGSALLLKTINGLRQGSITATPQKGNVTYAPPITKEQGRINWQDPARDIFNLVRGLYIWPNAYTYLGNERIKLFCARAIEGEGMPGRIESLSEGRLVVGSGKGMLAIEELQPEGRKRMLCRDFLAGRTIRPKYDYFS